MWIRLAPAALGILLVMAGISDLGAQTPPRRIYRSSDTTLAGITERYRTHGGALYVRELLTQQLGPQSRQKLDALADSLAVIAIEYRPGDPIVRRRAAGNAVSNIAHAAVTEEGVRYTGAFERLARIVENAPDVGIRGRALDGIAALPERDRSLAYLRKIAISTELQRSNAYMAVEILSGEMGPEGEAILKELWREGLVQDSWANDLLEGIAYLRKWE